MTDNAVEVTAPQGEALVRTHQPRRHRRWFAIAGVLALVLAASIVPSASAALRWDPVQRTTGQYAHGQPDVLVASGSTLHRLLSRAHERSTDGGRTWDRTVLLPADGDSSAFSTEAIAASGSTVVALVAQRYDREDGGPPPHLPELCVMRSSDGGTTWQGSVPCGDGALNGTRDFTDANVAMGDEQHVTVTWDDAEDGRVYVRTSTDGGATFGLRRALGITTRLIDSASPMNFYTFYSALPTVAARGALVFVVWTPSAVPDNSEDNPRDAQGLVIRTSTNYGASFAAVRTVTTIGIEAGPGLYAPDPAIFAGPNLLIHYMTTAGRLRVTTSTDGGHTFVHRVVAAPAGGITYFPGDVVMGSRAARVAFVRFEETGSRTILLRRSLDGGLTWEGTEPVITSGAVARRDLNIVMWPNHTGVMWQVSASVLFRRS